MNVLNVPIPNDLQRALEELCQQQDRPLSDAVRDALRRYVAAEQFRTLRRRTLPLAEAQGFLTDDDVFEAIS